MNLLTTVALMSLVILALRAVIIILLGSFIGLCVYLAHCVRVARAAMRRQRDRRLGRVVQP